MVTMSTVQKKERRLPFLQGILPIVPSQIPIDIVAGITLAALGIPEVMGYTKIAGTPSGSVRPIAPTGMRSTTRTCVTRCCH